MTMLQIDITELKELRDEMNEIINQIERMNAVEASRIAKFNALDLTPELRKQVLTTIFSEE